MAKNSNIEWTNGHRKDVEISLDEKMLLAPLKWKKPRMIFVCSMTDLFADFVTDKWIDRVFAVMALCPQHTFQILTKRSKRMREWGSASRVPWRRIESALVELLICAPAHALNRAAELSERHGDGFMPRWPLPNVWLGVSCEDQQRADERIPDLLNTPAAVRFVSYEPALGPVDFWQDGSGPLADGEPRDYNDPRQIRHGGPRIDWIICGGESGPSRRPFEIAWAEDVMRQCKEAGTKFFFKQDAGPRPGMRGRANDELWAMKETP